MKKIITYETLRNFAYSNDHLIKGEVRGIVLKFYGLGGMTIHNNDPGDALEYAERNIILVIPYHNPWAWMNRATVALVDEIIEVLCEKYSLSESVKIVSTGGSMGGLSSLVYCAYAKITPTACVASCPVCDLPYHFTERPDLPRTLYSAFAEYDGELDEAMKSCSPLHLVDKMPDIPYTVFHCEADTAVNIDRHSRRFVEAMKKSHRITLRTVPLRPHCSLSASALVEFENAIFSALE